MLRQLGSLHLKFPDSLRKKNGATRLALLVICALFAILPSGCKKSGENRLTPAQIHQLTRDLAAAASSGAPAGTAIKSRQGVSGESPGNTGYLRIVLSWQSSCRVSILPRFAII